MATVPATPSSFSTKGVSALSPISFLQRQAVEESVLGSVWDKLSGMTTAEYASGQVKVEDVPENSILLKLDTTLQGKIPSQIRMSFQNAYNECERGGTNENMLGYEEDTRWKFLTCYYNEIKKSFKFWGWGKFANEHDFYDALKKKNQRIINWWAENHDRRIQQAILQRYEQVLTKPDVSVSQHFNPNWFIPNTAVCAQPSYDHDDLTVTDEGDCPYSDTFQGDFVELLGDALYAATNNGANPEYCQTNVECLIALDYYCRQTLRMPTVKVGGKNVRVCVLPSSMCAVLVNPFQAGMLGAIYKSGLPDQLQQLPGVVGMVRSLLIIENDRYPTLTLAGSNNAWTFQPGYMHCGNNDGRNTACFSNTSGDLNYAFHVGYVLGPNAVVEWVAKTLDYGLKEMTEYEKIVGIGSKTEAGIQLAVFDNDTKTDTSYYHNASCIVPIAAPNIITVQ